jgi:anti-sigma regulatory factor (Ser/Thr protein kinase)
VTVDPDVGDRWPIVDEEVTVSSGMTATLPDAAHGPAAAFRHEALFYSGDDGFLAGTVPFLTEAVTAGEPSLVVVSAARIAMLRAALEQDADRVFFADMAAVGRNPARIIPAWRDFLEQHAPDGRPVRGIGEPIWAARTPAELVECQQHEALLNVAFGDSAPWQLVCPYDVDALPAAVVEEAIRSHPFVREVAGDSVASDAFSAAAMPTSQRSVPLPEPSRCLESMTFTDGQLGLVRHLTDSRSAQFGLTDTQLDDFVLAVHEVAANSVRHGGGEGRFRLWRDGRSLVAEVSDRGTIVDPLVGRRLPGDSSERGRGLWIANQVCDLVQIRTYDFGTVVRLHLSLDQA